MEGHQNNKRPNLGHRGGRGLFRHLGSENDWGSETTEARTAFIKDWIASLSNRLRNVRVCCGNWSRVCSSDTVLGGLGTVGIFLDPPYATDLDRLAEWKKAILSGNPVEVKKSKCGNRSKGLYLNDSDDPNKLLADVNLWCFAFGADPNNRIVICGLDQEHNDLEAVGWKSITWLPNGGYSNLSAASPNSRRERLWASPACLNDVGELPFVIGAK